jgi:DNA mismatch endonuclease (patch repair protein)
VNLSLNHYLILIFEYQRVDRLTKQQRSFTMSRINSKWTKLELFVHGFLKGKKVRHKMHPNIPGRPDVLLVDSNTAIFLHGCFWHKCPEHFVEPLTNKDYWIPKIERNVERDKGSVEALKDQGYKVLVIWEHQIKKNPDEVKSLLLESSRIWENLPNDSFDEP